MCGQRKQRALKCSHNEIIQLHDYRNREEKPEAGAVIGTVTNDTPRPGQENAKKLRQNYDLINAGQEQGLDFFGVELIIHR